MQTVNTDSASKGKTLVLPKYFFFSSEPQLDDELIIIMTFLQSSLRFQDSICKALSIIFCAMYTDRLLLLKYISNDC